MHPSTFTINGETRTLSEWSRIYNISPQTAWGRLKKGADPLEAFTAPPGTIFKKRKVDKSRCHICQYRNYLDHAHTKGQVYCEYVYHVGHRRPCKSENCTACVPGPMLAVRTRPFVPHERGWKG